MGNPNKSILYHKTFNFSLKSVNLYKYLTYEKSEFIMSKQYLRCSTSIGANISESLEAQNTKDFISKLYISLKEARETEYWLKLLEGSNFIDPEIGHSLFTDLKEIIIILNSIIKKSKEAINSK